MSDPMTNVEIEDVLSSIRRLVAQDPPPRPVPPGRLILTPALRIDEPAAGAGVGPAADATPPDAASPDIAPSDTAPPEAAAQGIAASEGVVCDDASLDPSQVAGSGTEALSALDGTAPDPVSDTSFAAEQVAAEQFEEQAVEEFAAEAPESPVQQNDKPSVPQDAPGALADAQEAGAEDQGEVSVAWAGTFDGGAVRAAPAEEIPAAPFHHVGDEEVAASEEAEAATMVPTPFLRHRDRKSLEDTVAELEAAVSRQSFDWEPDGIEAGEPASVEPAGTAADGAGPEAPSATQASDGAAVVSEPVPPEVEADDAAESLEADLLAEFAAPADEEVDADDAEDTHQGDNAPIVFLSASRRLRPEGPGPREIPDETGQGTEVADLSEATMLPAAEAGQFLPALPLDEEALRELVAKVLREELRGELGERITRNVRKLVRREIAQIISGLEVD